MPKGKSGKGGKNRRRGKKGGQADKRELVFKEDGQEYAQVIKMLGNGRLEVSNAPAIMVAFATHCSNRNIKQFAKSYPRGSFAALTVNDANCFDGKKRLCHIRGKFRKRVWINAGDVILLGLRDFEDNKADVIHKYSPEEARTLKAYDEIPSKVVIGGQVGDEEEEGEDNVHFGAPSEEEEDSIDANADVDDILGDL